MASPNGRIEGKTFQSTLPRRERLSRDIINNPNVYFNPRSRGGSDVARSAGSADIEISIHAPAEGATTLRSVLSSHLLDFNPRSRGGSDSYVVFVNVLCRKFQSTLPRRERRGSVRREESFMYFNPRSRGGSDTG